MATFPATNYFSLDHFAHHQLFEPGKEVWEAIKHLPDYIKTLKLGKIESIIPPGVLLVNPDLISIGKDTEIEPGSYIAGPCVIGNKCSIRQGAYIRGNVIAGNECVIGHCTEVKNSILLDGAKAAHFAYLGDTILGNDVNIGAGVKFANLKLDGSYIIIHFEGKHYATGLRKFGAIVGDKSQIGCNSVTNPGTLMGQNCALMPCINFGGVVPKESRIYSESKISIKPKKLPK